MTEHQLPRLPYAYDALEPYYDQQTVELHHGKHHQSYVDGLNKALSALAKARSDNDFGAITHLERLIAFHGGGHLLHSTFWTNLKPSGGGRPEGRLAEAISRDFGSFEAFDAQLRAAATGIQGSGWAALTLDPYFGHLHVLAIENHQNQLLPGAVPILVVDMWEHAFYLKYQNRKAEWVAAVMDNLVNWEDVARRFDDAV